jgi:hypothetical protein
MKSRFKILLQIITIAVFTSAFTLNIQSSLNDPYQEVIDAETVVVIKCYNATISPSGFFRQMICLDGDYQVYCRNEYYTDFVSTGECRFGTES